MASTDDPPLRQVEMLGQPIAEASFSPFPTLMLASVLGGIGLLSVASGNKKAAYVGFLCLVAAAMWLPTTIKWLIRGGFSVRVYSTHIELADRRGVTVTHWNEVGAFDVHWMKLARSETWFPYRFRWSGASGQSTPWLPINQRYRSVIDTAAKYLSAVGKYVELK